MKKRLQTFVWGTQRVQVERELQTGMTEAELLRRALSEYFDKKQKEK